MLSCSRNMQDFGLNCGAENTVTEAGGTPSFYRNNYAISDRWPGIFCFISSILVVFYYQLFHLLFSLYVQFVSIMGIRLQSEQFDAMLVVLSLLWFSATFSWVTVMRFVNLVLYCCVLGQRLVSAIKQLCLNSSPRSLSVRFFLNVDRVLLNICFLLGPLVCLSRYRIEPIV